MAVLLTMTSPQKKGSGEKKSPTQAKREAVEPSRLEIILAALDEPSISQLDKAKLLVELEKIQLERDKFQVATLVEDFKARWQELLNFENENSRWQTLYVTALMLVTSWVLTNSGPDGRYRDIGAIFAGNNSYFLLSLALINAIYTLAMAYKGFQIQEIAQYLYVQIGQVINGKASPVFGSWERWRRDEKGQPTLIRNFYYSIIGILPTAVSAVVLILFAGYEYANASLKLIFYFYFTVLFVVTTLCLALLTTKMNKKWNEILK